MKFTMLTIVAIQKVVTSTETGSGKSIITPVNGTVTCVDADVEVDGHADGEQLPDELDDRLELVEVVEEADGDDDGHAADDAPHGAVDGHEDHDRQEPAEVHAETAEQRRGEGMHAPLVGGVVERAGAPGEPAHERGEKVDEHGGEQKAQDCGAQWARQADEAAYGSSSRWTSTPASASIDRESSSG